MPILDEIGKIGAPLFGDSISSFLHPEKGYQAALDELRKRYDEAKGYVTPYSQQGQQQYGTLSGGINTLMNPESLISRFISSYKTSPYAQQLLEQNKEQGLEDASSMGLMGSSAALNNIQKGAGDIVSSDREKYINMLMNNYLQGLGLSKDIYNTGAGAAESLMQGANQMGQNEAGLAFGKQNAPGNMFENLLKLGTNLFSGGGGGFLS